MSQEQVQGTRASTPSLFATSDRALELNAKYPNFDLDAKIGDLGQLHEICPDLTVLLLEGISEQILMQMRGHQERLKEVIREGRRQ